MLPWSLFSTALGEASNSLIGNERLISKVYFPRLIVPTATVVVAFVDFLISFCMLVLLMAWLFRCDRLHTTRQMGWVSWDAQVSVMVWRDDR